VKLLLYSHYFAPSIGGVETIVMSLARGLAELRAENGAQEFEITLVTQTPREDFDDSALPFPVIRQPGFWRLMRLVRGADAVHLAGPALAPLALGLLWRKPVVVEHHGFQVICPTGQLLIESRGEPCPGHFMAGEERNAGIATQRWIGCFRKIVAAHFCAAIFEQTSGGQHHADEMARRTTRFAARDDDSSRADSNWSGAKNRSAKFAPSGDCVSGPAGFDQGCTSFAGCDEDTLRTGRAI